MPNSENPKKHHFVPESYLQNFSFDSAGNLYVLPIKSPYKNIKVKKLNKSQICYEKYLYKIKTSEFLDKLNIDDPFTLEKNLFDYEENFLNKISSKFSNKEDINKSDAKNLIRMLLNFKHRNKVLLKPFSTFFKIGVKERLEIVKNKISAHKEEYGDELVDNLLLKLDKEVLKNIDNEDFISDHFNKTLKDLTQGHNETHNWLVNQMLKSKFYIFCTTPNFPFITNDNPGFTMHDGDIVRNTLVNGAKAFAFPVTPLHLFVISPNDTEGFKSIIKPINYRFTNQKFVELTNNATIINSSKIIISNRKEILEDIRKKHHNQY